MVTVEDSNIAIAELELDMSAYVEDENNHDHVKEEGSVMTYLTGCVSRKPTPASDEGITSSGLHH